MQPAFPGMNPYLENPDLWTEVHSWLIVQLARSLNPLLAKVKTQTGLTVFTTLLDKVYETGRKVTQEFKETMEIAFDEYLPQWNYTARPQS